MLVGTSYFSESVFIPSVTDEMNTQMNEAESID